jgi:hypothetical protein
MAPKFDVPPALAGAIALIVAALAAVGVSGGALTRAVRNDPTTIALLVIVLLVAVAVPVVASVRGSRAIAGSVIVLVLVLCATVWTGARSVGEREQPRVALSASTKDQVTTITVIASGSGLKSNQDMLVQMQGLEGFPASVHADNGCARSGSDTVGSLLLWQQAGPDGSGAVSVESKVEVPVAEYAGVCAYVSLRNDPSGDDRWVRSYLRTPGFDN